MYLLEGLDGFLEAPDHTARTCKSGVVDLGMSVNLSLILDLRLLDGAPDP